MLGMVTHKMLRSKEICRQEKIQTLARTMLQWNPKHPTLPSKLPHPPPNSPHPPPNPPKPSPPPPPPPNPIPNPEQQNIGNLTVLQYNIYSFNTRIEELLHYMEENQIKIAALQETWLSKKVKAKPTPNYTLVRKDREHDNNTTKGGALAFLVHKSIPFNSIKSTIKDKHTEELTIAIKEKDSQLYIRNIYIPPATSCQNNYIPPYKSLIILEIQP